MEKREYGIIREQGEYMEPIQLTAEENAAVNKEKENESKEKEKK